MKVFTPLVPSVEGAGYPRSAAAEVCSEVVMGRTPDITISETAQPIWGQKGANTDGLSGCAWSNLYPPPVG